MKNYSLFLLSLLFLLISCEEPVGIDREPYFDVKTLVQNQAHWLDSLNPSLILASRIGADDETHTMHQDSAGWAEVLQLFAQVDINRPVLQGSYQVEDSVDQQKNLPVRIYKSVEAQAEIPYVKVYYQDSLTNVRHIEAYFQEDNLLYSTSRKMDMDFVTEQNHPRLEQFKILGKQKMIFRDSVEYQTVGKLRYN